MYWVRNFKRYDEEAMETGNDQTEDALKKKKSPGSQFHIFTQENII